MSSRPRAIAKETLTVIDRGFHDRAAGPVAIGSTVVRDFTTPRGSTPIVFAVLDRRRFAPTYPAFQGLTVSA